MWWCSLSPLCLPGAGMEAQQRGSHLGTAPEGLNSLALLMGLPCLHRMGFTGILTPKVLRTPLCSLHNPSLLYPCSEDAGR